jgi:hypothetical protein
MFSGQVVHSRSTLQRQLRRQIKKNTLHLYNVLIYSELFTHRIPKILYNFFFHKTTLGHSFSLCRRGASTILVTNTKSNNSQFFYFIKNTSPFFEKVETPICNFRMTTSNSSFVTQQIKKFGK